MTPQKAKDTGSPQFHNRNYSRDDEHQAAEVLGEAKSSRNHARPD